MFPESKYIATFPELPDPNVYCKGCVESSGLQRIKVHGIATTKLITLA